MLCNIINNMLLVLVVGWSVVSLPLVYVLLEYLSTLHSNDEILSFFFFYDWGIWWKAEPVYQ